MPGPTTTTAGTGLLQANDLFTFGGEAGTNSYDASAWIDEVRVSKIVRSTGWIATEYNNQNSPATFSTVGALEGSNTVSPTTNSCTLGSATDQSYTVTLNDNTLSSVTNGATTLTSGTDYTWSSPTLTLKAAYLNNSNAHQVTVGSNTITITMSGGTAPTITETVSAGNSTVSPTSNSCTLGTAADQTYTITLNGRTLSSVTNTTTTDTLTLNTDYTWASPTLTLKAAYLNNLNAHQVTLGSNTITLNMSGGTNPTITETASAGNSTVSPATGSWTLGTATDQNYTVALNGRTLLSLTNGGYTLVHQCKHEDYIWDGTGALVLSAAYLNTLSVGTSTITLTMDGGTNPSIVLTVNAGNTSVSPATTTVTFAAVVDLSANVTLNGRTLSSVTNGGYTLQSSTDYTWDGAGTLVLKASYMSTLPLGSQTLTLTMSGGANPQIALTVALVNSTVVVTPSLWASSSPLIDHPYTVTLNSYTLSSVTNGGYTLQSGTDYTWDGTSALVLEAAYLSTLPLGDSTLTLSMSGGTNPTILLTKSTTDTWTLGTLTDKSYALVLSSRTLSGITKITNGSALALVSPANYTWDGTTLVLKAAYLNTLPIGESQQLLSLRPMKNIAVLY